MRVVMPIIAVADLRVAHPVSREPHFFGRLLYPAAEAMECLLMLDVRLKYDL